jgi:sterol desaturase/sphingolipid hydroxylase (fatty acid hydroxylase superfamily)
MSVASAVPFVIPGCFVGLTLLERWFPARPQVRVRGWTPTGLVAFAVTGAISSSLPRLYIGVVKAHRLFDLSWLGTLGGAAVGLLVIDGIGYWLHRARHARPLWRWHQMHHAAERLDVMGASYFHPIDVVLTTLLGSIAAALLGVTAQAAALGSMVAVCISFFTHMNIATPRWLGYIMTRPESHSVHHARGIHAGNYALLPLWDIVFGTFVNPKHFEPAVGFYDGATSRLGTLLAGAEIQ